MDQAPADARKKRLVKLAIALVAALAIGFALLAGFDVKALIKQGTDLITQLGPVAYFCAMALLPAVGAPLLAFVLTVGPAFAERFGLGPVIALSLVAITFNLTLTYVLARWLIRPLLKHLIEKLGYRLPELGGTDKTDLLIILRVTPGIPFCVQNYLAGLADVPMGRYFFISCLVAWSYNSGFIVFGDALLQGKGRMALLAIGVLAALTAGAHMVRKHYAGKKREAGSEKRE